MATVLLLVVLVPRMLHWDGGGEEHYLSVKRVNDKTNVLPTPAELLVNWYADKDHDPDKPLVIITATGGGLHASPGQRRFWRPSRLTPSKMAKPSTSMCCLPARCRAEARA